MAIERNRKKDSREVLPPLVSSNDMLLDAPAWLLSAAIHMLIVIILVRPQGIMGKAEGRTV
jgi:hypothetical protein